LPLSDTDTMTNAPSSRTLTLSFSETGASAFS